MSDTISYSRLVSIIFKQLNKFRENPSILSDSLEERSKKYDDTVYHPNKDDHIKIQTAEGIQPVLELISIIKMKNVFPVFNWSYELHCAANERADNIAISYIHNESEQMPIENVVGEYASWSGNLSEHVLYGFCDPK